MFRPCGYVFSNLGKPSENVQTWEYEDDKREISDCIIPFSQIRGTFSLSITGSVCVLNSQIAQLSSH